MSDSNSEIFTTDDTPLAAYLITEGFQLVDIIFKGKFAHYLFPNNDEKLIKLKKEFDLMSAHTNAAQIIFNYQNLVKRAKRGF